MDMLTSMLVAQHNLQLNTFNLDFTKMTDVERIAFIKEMKLALEAELQEALNEVGWKPWATSRHLHGDLYLTELIDALHFLLNMFLVLGHHPQDLATYIHGQYMSKNKRNAERQVEGYSGIKSNP